MNRPRRFLADIKAGWREGREASRTTRKPDLISLANASFAVGLFVMGAVSSLEDGNGWLTAAWVLGAVAWGASAYGHIRNARRYLRLAEPALAFATPAFRDLHDPDVVAIDIDIRLTRGGPDEWNATRTTYTHQEPR